MKIKPAGKIAIVILISSAVGLYFGVLRDMLKPSDNSPAAAVVQAGVTVPSTHGAANPAKPDLAAPAAAPTGKAGLCGGQGQRPCKIAISEWPGHMGVVVAIGGKTTQAGSYASTVTSSQPGSKPGINIEILFIDDPIKRNAALQTGEVDGMWSTVDEMPINVPGYIKAGLTPKAFVQVDWSRGGDACVSTKEIQKIEDIPGHKVAVLKFCPDHTLLEYAQGNSRLNKEQIAQVRKDTSYSMDDPTFARLMFTQEKVDVACVWEPDVSLALKRPGSHVLFSSKDADHLIADVLLANEANLKADPDMAEKIAKVFIYGADQIVKDPQSAAKLVHATSPKFREGGTVDDVIKAFGWVKPASLGDNVVLFGLNGSDPDFDRVFAQADTIWNEYPDAEIQNRYVPKTLRTDLYIRPLFDAEKANREAAAKAESAKEGKPVAAAPIAEVKPVFDPKEAVKAEVKLSKPVTLNFDSGKSELDSESIRLLRTQVLPQIKLARGMYIKVEGNTDDQGSAAVNKSLSLKRAEAVRQYLVEQGLDPNQVVAKGNGPDNPIASNKTADGRAANRRTDIQFAAND